MAKEQTPVPTLTTNSGSPVEDNQQHHCRTAWSGAAPGLLVVGKVTARDSVAATLPFLRADLGYGFGVAKALGIELSEDVVRTLCQPRPATVNWSRQRSAEFALT
jgi:hypothetical protein